MIAVIKGVLINLIHILGTVIIIGSNNTRGGGLKANGDSLRDSSRYNIVVYLNI